MSFEDFLKIAWSSLIMESSVHAFDPKTKQNHAQIGPHRCDQTKAIFVGFSCFKCQIFKNFAQPTDSSNHQNPRKNSPELNF